VIREGLPAELTMLFGSLIIGVAFRTITPTGLCSGKVTFSAKRQ
jgi:hypothetical protein